MLTPKFVEFMPDNTFEDGILYVSMRFEVAIHLCPCGCGEKTVTPLGANGWTLTFDETVTLSPSIGSFQIPCKSHYWIRANQIVWA